MLKKEIFNLFTFLMLFIIHSIVHAQYQELYVPKIPNKIQLKLDEKTLELFHTNIKNIADSKIVNIEKINKQYFPLNISFQNDSKTERCEARARINGDWKDHVKSEEQISSLTIQLKECAIGGLTKFRLLLPETKNGSTEIFWSMLLEEYGFPALYSQMIDVDLNSLTFKALLMEIPSTVFLERHGIRESVIIEADEQQLWNARAYAYYRANVLNDPSYIDRPSSFFDKNENNSFVYQTFGDFGSLDNKEYAQGELKTQITMRALSQYIAGRNVVNSNFFYQIQSIWAPHGLGHNKKLIYLPMTNSFIPLYYDGMIDLGPNQELMPLASRAPTYFLEKCSNDQRFPDKNFSTEFIRRSGEELSSQMKCVYAQINKNLSHLNNWSQSQLDQNIQTGQSPIDYGKISNISKHRLRSGFKGVYMNMLVLKNGEYLLCKITDTSQICDPIDFKRAHKILTKGEVIKLGEHKFLATSVAGELDPSIDSKGISIEMPSTYNIDIKPGQKYYLQIKSGNSRNININLQGAGARAIVYGELNDGDKVSISGNAPNVFKESRHDELMLTGCITFLNTKFDNPSLSSAATGCEDAINILNSNGTIRNINIQNATEDALDLDFSNIQIESLHISGTGNDCLDISTGSYQIGSASLKNCGDKAVSAGEYAQVKLDRIVVDGATLGLVAKDGALLSVNQFQGFNVKEKCIDAFIKKKRFPIGHVYAVSNQCTVSPSKASASRN